jgi:hypothetical protein
MGVGGTGTIGRGISGGGFGGGGLATGTGAGWITCNCTTLAGVGGGGFGASNIAQIAPASMHAAISKAHPNRSGRDAGNGELSKDPALLMV